MLISCSLAVTPLFNTDLCPFSLYEAWVGHSQYIPYLKGKRICYCEITTLCVFSLLQTSADAFPSLHGWMQESHVTLVVLSAAFPQPHPPFSPPYVNWWVGSCVFGKTRDGLGTAERISLLDPKDCCGLASWTVWQIQETSHGDSVQTQNMYWGK